MDLIVLVGNSSPLQQALTTRWINQDRPFCVIESAHYAGGELCLSIDNIPFDQVHHDQPIVLCQLPLLNSAETWLSTLFYADKLCLKSVWMPYVPYARNRQVCDTLLHQLNQPIKTFDFHNQDGMQKNIPQILSISSFEIFGQTFQNLGLSPKETVVAFPDHGAFLRSASILNHFPFPFMTAQKTRNGNSCKVDFSKFSEFSNINNAILVDDMVSTGQTLKSAIQALRQRGIKHIFAFVTHVLPETAFYQTFCDIVNQVDIFWTTNIHPWPNKYYDQLPNLKMIDVSRLFSA